MNKLSHDLPVAAWQSAFKKAVESFRRDKPLLLLTHNDADGLCSAAILHRVFFKVGQKVEVRILGRGENPWNPGIQEELKQRKMGGLIVTDLGVRSGTIRKNVPTLLIDHHHPMGDPPGATVITGFGSEPTPTSGLLSYWCAQQVSEVDDLLWLAAVSIIGDMAEKLGFLEMAEARQRYGITALREATTLLNAARRSGSGKAEPAYDLLLRAGPKDVLSGRHPETQVLQEAREEVAAALSTARRAAPKVKGDVAIILIDSPCQIHPIIAQQWKARLHKNVVIAANKGYREGWVHFSVRSALGRDLIAFLREKAPVSADKNYGSGHLQATGGALRMESWNEFVTGLEFGPEVHVNP